MMMMMMSKWWNEPREFRHCGVGLNTVPLRSYVVSVLHDVLRVTHWRSTTLTMSAMDMTDSSRSTVGRGHVGLLVTSVLTYNNLLI